MNTLAGAERLPKVARRKVPTMLQLEATECGAAALGMVLASHGLWLPLEALREGCGVSRDGSKAGSLLRAARRLGMDAKGWRVDPAGLADHPMPVIAFWEFNHFVVIEGCRHDRVYLNDPATGPRVIDRAEFDRAFTGILLTFTPTDTFQRAGSPPRAWRTLLPHLMASRAALAFLLIAGLLALVPALAVPIASKIFVDQVLLDHLDSWLRPLMVALLLTAILRIAVSLLQETAVARLQWHLSLAIGLGMARHLLSLPATFFAQRHVGDVASRFTSVEDLCHLLSGQIATLAIAALSATIYGLLMLMFDPVLASVGVLAALIGGLVVSLSARMRSDLVRRLRRDQAALASISISGLQTIETLKAAGLEDGFFARWSNAQARLLNARQRSVVPLMLLGVVPVLLGGLADAAVLGLGAVRIMGGWMTVGDLIAFQFLLGGFMAPVRQLVTASSALQDLRGDLERVEDVLRYPVDPRLADSDVPMTQGRLRGHVELRDIRFGYSPLEPPLIEGFNLVLEPGRRVALVGPSGSGKSTLARILAGLNRPWEGQVLLDGVPVQDWPRGLISASVAAVDQRICLFQGSIRENLTLWDPSVPEPDVIAAARDACIHATIAARPSGYGAPVAEAGANFSGGETQRLEIARALVPWPSVLILDEATSALDPLVEAEMLENLRRRGCTTLLVAHRLSTVRDCDEIIVMKQGHIVERGTHDELVASGGAYAALIHAD